MRSHGRSPAWTPRERTRESPSGGPVPSKGGRRRSGRCIDPGLPCHRAAPPPRAGVLLVAVALLGGVADAAYTCSVHADCNYRGCNSGAGEHRCLPGPGLFTRWVFTDHASSSTRVPFVSALSADGSTLYARREYKLYAINTTDGSLKWSYTTTGLSSHATISPDGSKVYVGGYVEGSTSYHTPSGLLYAINTADGSLMWTYATSSRNNLRSPTVSTDGAVVYVSSSADRSDVSSALYAINTADKSLLWSYSGAGSNQFSAPPALSPDGSKVYVGCYDFKLYAINTADGSLAWRYPTGRHMHSSSSGPTVSPDGAKVYVCSDKLYSINTADGSLAWSYPSYTTGEDDKYYYPTLSEFGMELHRGGRVSRWDHPQPRRCSCLRGLVHVRCNERPIQRKIPRHPHGRWD